MKKLFLIFITLYISACSNQNSSDMRDHVCINKTEAKQFFEENLVLEVKIIDGKRK